MAAHKKNLTSFIIVLIMIVLSMFSECGEGMKRKHLGYGAIGKDRIPACGFKNPKECIKIPANPYHRGCETSTRCRHQISL
ncbi:PREDICTED: protein RALF-like 7 [Camelina sativa]|uniref:Protein RALF-like 7 n=1 Tax=Camelina sativa TaxID=90675 RepID=A0ABM1R540_CAMSA|nr:PREDICTED: protein RALF-like 7 [Camelina sativa]